MKDNIYEVIIAGQRFYLGKAWVEAVTSVVRLASRSVDGYYVPVQLVRISQQFIATIKEVRVVTGATLKDAKYLCDKVRDGHPQELGVFPYNEAEDIKARFEEIGSKVELPSALALLAREAE